MPSRVSGPSFHKALAVGLISLFLWGDPALGEEPEPVPVAPSLSSLSSELAPPILQLTASPSPRKVDTLALFTLQFKLPDSLPLDAGVRVTFPAGFGLEALVDAFYDDSDGVAPNPRFLKPPLRSGQSVDCFLDSTGTATQAGSFIVVKLPKVKNPTVKATYQVALEILSRDSTLLYGPNLSPPFSLIPGTAASISVTPTTPSLVMAGRTLLLSAAVKDSLGNTFDTATVTWRVEPASLGIQTGPVFNARRVDTGRVFAHYGTLQDASSGLITVRPGTLAIWEVAGLPASAVAGENFVGDSIVVTAKDAFGNRKTDYFDSLYFSSSDPAALLPATQGAPYLFGAPDAGRHAFPATAFVLYQAGTDTIFLHGGGTTVSLQIAVGSAAAVDFSARAPDSVTAGEAFTVSASNVIDLYGNSAGGAIALYLNAADSAAPSGQLPFLPDLQAVAGGGGASVRLYRAGRYPIFARVGDSIRVTDSILVQPASAASFDLQVAEPQFSGVAFTGPATITALDAFRNVDVRYDQSGRTVTVSAQNGDSMTQNTLGAALFSLGVADLVAHGVTYNGRGGQVTFQVSDGVAQGTSSPVDVVALRMDTVSFDQTEVRRGVDILTGTIVLRVQGVGQADVSALSLETAFGSFPLAAVTPALPDIIVGPTTRAYDFTWPVDGALPQSCVTFGARVLGAFGADPVSSEFSGGPCVSVVSAAMPTLTALSPDTVGYTAVRYLATVTNSGIRGVTLELPYARLITTDSAGRVDTALSEAGGQVFLYPDSALVLGFLGNHASPFTADAAYATLELRGFESGRPFTQSTAFPSVLRFRPTASVTYVTNTLSTDTLLLGRPATIFLRLANAGGVPVQRIRPESTWIELRGLQDTAHLPLNSIATPLVRLNAGSDTSLAFNLSAAEARLSGGTYQARLQVVGEQNNLHFKAAFSLGESIDLVGEAQIRIDSVWLTAPNAPRVSTGQAFTVNAKISNQGLEPIDSVQLSLFASAGALFNTNAQITTIPQADFRTAQWSVTADVVPVLFETFSVDVTRAVGRFTGAPARILPALDAQAAVQVQAPASVVVEADIYLPPEAADLRVAAGSEFQVAARFVNLGEAQIGGGSLRVNVTGGLVVLDTTVVVTLPPGGEAIWSILAPIADTTALVVVALDGTVDELNTSEPAEVAIATDSLAIEVAFEAPPLLVYDVRFESGQVDSVFTPLRWVWKNNDPSGQFPVLVKRIEIEMLSGRSGTRLAASNYLTAAELDMAGTIVAADLSGGTILFGADSLRRIASGDSEEVVLRVVPRTSAAFAEYRFATEAGLWSVVERFISGGGLAVPVLGDRGGSLKIESPVAFQSGTAPANYPNPFRAGVENTQIVYSLAANAEVSIVLFAADGREVWSHRAAAGTPGGSVGANSVVWDGRTAAGRTVFDGVYLARIQGGGLDATLKVAVIK